MLQELNIENYAVVEQLRIRFHAGLNLLTGETGGGKSILVDAFSLLLGARATAEVIRAGSRRARIAGIFEIDTSPPVRQLLEQSGLELEQDELIVEREVLENGKPRAYVNGRVVTRGRHGVSLVTPSSACHLPAHAREVFDVAGAGDTLVAAFALALAGGASLLEAVSLANVAAGLVVQARGVAVTTREELRRALAARERWSREVMWQEQAAA